MTAPEYQALTNRAIPEVARANGQGQVRVISGSYEEAKGAASTFSPAHMFDGPFVMNSVDEINEAIMDYRNGTFGRLDD